MVVGVTITYAIIIDVVNFESDHDDGVQHFAIKFVSDLGQVGGFLWFLRFPPPIKLTTTI
jgi:hypothetical protein